MPDCLYPFSRKCTAVALFPMNEKIIPTKPNVNNDPKKATIKYIGIPLNKNGIPPKKQIVQLNPTFTCFIEPKGCSNVIKVFIKIC